MLDKTMRTFYEVRSWNTSMPGRSKRHSHILGAMLAAAELQRRTPGSKYYVTQSIGRFDSEGYTPW